MYRNDVKRILDILLSVIALPFFLLVLLVIAPIIWLSDRGSVFYNAPRLGKNGEIFTMYKFRTMRMNAPDLRNADGSTYNASDDPRLTRIGALLRKLSIDEIPQVLNVLKGDMSLIGPRPDLPEHAALYGGEEQRKLEVRPGITGLAQAYHRNSIDWKKRISLDVYYIDHLSFGLDVRIFCKTVFSVLKRERVFIEPAATKQEPSVLEKRI